VWREINMTGKKKKKTIGLIYFLINWIERKMSVCD
jgi:hypothetical protein